MLDATLLMPCDFDISSLRATLLFADTRLVIARHRSLDITY